MFKHLLILLIIALALPAFAETCNYKDCHSDIAEQPKMHSPVADGDCLTCHVADDELAAKHQEDPENNKNFSSPVGEGENLCLMCHEPFNKDKSNVHDPVANDDCTSCHNPHGSKAKYMLISDVESDTCFQCHDNDKTVKKFVHGPVAAGQCVTCHDPHASNNKYQLKKKSPELCLGCHTEKSNSMTAAHKHQPVIEDCTICHDPHNSDYEMFLKKDMKDLCFDCHKKLGERVRTMKYVHAPVAQNGCSACHDVHGSENPYILFEYFPKTFYNDYQKGLYKLCFECHDETKLTKASTTGFRNGNENLHKLHVTMEKKGRSCKACHEVHASSQPLHIRASVPFGTGGWELPIKYTKNKNGGTCVVGCHKPKTYDRVKAYDNK